jgi:uncharacterized OB-fold protein
MSLKTSRGDYRRIEVCSSCGYYQRRTLDTPITSVCPYCGKAQAVFKLSFIGRSVYVYTKWLLNDKDRYVETVNGKQIRTRQEALELVKGP